MFDKKKMDLDSLDELIAKCEDAMVGRFRKKAPEPEMEEGEEEEAPEEEHEEAKPDLEDMELEDLIEMYQRLQDEKGEE